MDEPLDAVPNKHFGYQQKRSKETFDKLIHAAEEIIAETSLDDASVADIAERAGVSVGAFYRRFQSKEGLLEVVHERYTDRMCRAQGEALDPAKWEGMTIEQILTAWTNDVIAATRRNLPLIRASTRRGQDDPGFAAREARIVSESYNGLVRLLLQHVDEITHPQIRTAVDFIAADFGAATYQRFIVSHLRADHLSDEEWARELVRSMLAYLGVKATATR